MPYPPKLLEFLPSFEKLIFNMDCLDEERRIEMFLDCRTESDASTLIYPAGIRPPYFKKLKL